MPERTVEPIDWSRASSGDPRFEKDRTGTPEATDKTAALRLSIQTTRNRMSETLDEIGERLNPEHLKEQVKDSIHDATIGKVKIMAQNVTNRAMDTERSLVRAISENPIPAAMVGVGLGWLVMNARKSSRPMRGTYPNFDAPGYPSTSSRSYPYTDDARFGSAEGSAGGTDGVRQRADHIVSDVKDKAGELADRVQHVASDVKSETLHQADRLGDRFDESPLALGAISVAIGIAVGLALPATQKESALMGDTRDRLVDRVRGAASETKHKVQNVAGRVLEDAQSTAKQAARDEGLTQQTPV